MAFFLAGGAVVLELLAAHGIGQFGGENNGGHGNDRVTGDHHQGRDDLPDRGFGHDVTEAHGGEGDDSPIDTDWNAGEAVFGSFDHVHQGAKHGDERGNTDQKDDDFLLAAS